MVSASVRSPPSPAVLASPRSCAAEGDGLCLPRDTKLVFSCPGAEILRLNRVIGFDQESLCCSVAKLCLTLCDHTDCGPKPNAPLGCVL